MSTIPTGAHTSATLLTQMFMRIIAPPKHGPITSITFRRQATVLHWLALIMFTAIVMGTVIAFQFLDLRSAAGVNAFGTCVVCALASALTYISNRGGFYNLGALIMLGVIWLVPYYGSYVLANIGPMRDLFWLALISIMMSSILFLNQRTVLIAGLLNVTASLILHWLRYEFRLNVVFTPVLATSFVTACTLIIHIHRSNLEAERQAELIAINENLKHEIDERKLAQAQREVFVKELTIAKRMADEGSRIKSEFLATISHELRTPLNAIIGFSDMLLMGMNGDLNAKQTHKLERLRDNGMRLLTLINNVLDLTRLEARRVEIMNRPFSPHQLVKRMVAQMEVLAQQKLLLFNADIDAHLPVSILGDEQRIEQIIVNLLANAFKFTEKGAVTLSIDMSPSTEAWIIRVRDTGIGIPAHALNIIFEEFRQVDGSFSRNYKGSGLGLTITHNLIHLMHGYIAVESELGKGSTFTVTLPLINEATEPTESTVKPAELTVNPTYELMETQ